MLFVTSESAFLIYIVIPCITCADNLIEGLYYDRPGPVSLFGLPLQGGLSL